MKLTFQNVMACTKQKPLHSSLALEKQIFDYTSTLENQSYYLINGAFKWKKKNHTFYVM